MISCCANLCIYANLIFSMRFWNFNWLGLTSSIWHWSGNWNQWIRIIVMKSLATILCECKKSRFYVNYCMNWNLECIFYICDHVIEPVILLEIRSFECLWTLVDILVNSMIILSLILLGDIVWNLNKNISLRPSLVTLYNFFLFHPK